MDEVILVDKPKGWTSFDVVAKIRSNLRQQKGQKVKVGHAGTLDPLATGLLVVLVGKATKQQDEFMKKDKVYEIALKLGETSTTGDEEGEKTVIIPPSPRFQGPSLETVKGVLGGFVGEIEQIPPVYSAIKVNGQRAYKLARAGKEVKIEPRKVKIYEITGVEYDYPTVKFRATVSSGTYIRSLVADIGEKLGTGAYMTGLRRTGIGKYGVDDACSIDKTLQLY